MDKRRVVITGMGTVSPFGQGVKCLWEHLLNGHSAVQIMPDMQKLRGLRCWVAAVVPDVDASVIPRKKATLHVTYVGVFHCGGVRSNGDGGLVGGPNNRSRNRIMHGFNNGKYLRKRSLLSGNESHRFYRKHQI